MFLSWTRQTVSLDIGSQSVKVVVVRPGRGELPYELVPIGLAELPQGAIIDGAVADPVAVSNVIAELLDQHRVRTKEVAISISGNAVIVRRVNMARMAAEELRESICWEAEEYIPFDIDEVNLDFAILGDSDESESMDVVLVAAKKDRIGEHMAVVKDAKRRPIVLDLDAFAMQNAFEFSYPESQFEDIALINLGASLINLAVLEGGRPAFWRDIAVGVDEYVEALQRECMLDAFDAEDVLRPGSA